MRIILTIDDVARERRFSNVRTTGEGPYSHRPSTPEADWVSLTADGRLEGEHGSVGRLTKPGGGCAAAGGGAFVPFRWAVPPRYPDATIAFVIVRERLTSVPGHNLRALSTACEGCAYKCVKCVNQIGQRGWAATSATSKQRYRHACSSSSFQSALRTSNYCLTTNCWMQRRC
jgi:hypothetical protein